MEPTADEARLLRRAGDAFAAAVGPVLNQPRLRAWAHATLLDGVGERTARLADRLAEQPALSVAQGRLLTAAGRWPEDVPTPPELTEPVAFDDQLLLIERFALDVLALSDDPDDHDTLQRLRAALRGFGLTLTERGLRHGRSVGDLVLALSAAKDDAVVDILTREAHDLGERLRAVVITDFAESSSAVARADGTLNADAGSAVRVFHALIDDPATELLDPMLVTGSSVLVDADHGDQLLDALNQQLDADRLRARCRYRPTDHPQVREIVGEGPDWAPATYVRLLTEVFEGGETRCLVGTRGLFGEGWDSLPLNTLVDLTAVTTSTGVQQLRGRSIRLDSTWPQKVAHNWDVVCVAPDHPRGDRDLQRLIRRHQRSWGVVPPVAIADRLKTAAPSLRMGEPVAPTLRVTARAGRIVRGVAHVSPLLAWQLATSPLADIAFEAHTATCLRAIGDRDGSYELWDIGSSYDNFVTRATVLDVTDVRIRTVHTLRDNLKALARRVGAAAGVGAVLGAFRALQTGGQASGPALALMVLLGALLGTLVLLVVNRRDVLALVRALFVEQPPDAILLDVGRALLDGLQRAGLVSVHLQGEYVRVAEHDDATLEVTLDYASDEDAAAFIEAYRQLFNPVVDQRYLIWRTDQRLPSLPLTALWLPLRTLVRSRVGRPTYHPVPAVLAVNRKRAEAFAHSWARHVGGGELIYTRTEEGRRALLQARSQPRRSAKSMAFERWR